jgi:MFS family permease
LAERIGRRWATIIIGIPYLISWVLLALADGAGMLYVGRLFAGIATGASCVVAPMFVSEIAETSLRGALGAFFQLFLTVGILFVYVMGAIIPDKAVISWASAVFAVLLIIAVFAIPDSPIFLVKQVNKSCSELFANRLSIALFASRVCTPGNDSINVFSPPRALDKKPASP